MTTTCEQLGTWAVKTSWRDASRDARLRIKLHLLDGLGCVLGALGAEPIEAIRREQASAQVYGPSTAIANGYTSPERAAFFNGALVRYLDFMDTFVAPGEACHPSDNIAPVLTAAELANASGRDLLTGLLVAYQVQCRMTESGVPIMRAGFDHTIQLAISQAAGLARVLKLSASQAANAVAICTAQGLGLAASRAGNPVPQWKGLASAATGFSTIHNTRLAQSGITGPLDAFENPLGLEHVLGGHFHINWKREGLDAILRCSIKRYNAEFHSQSLIDGLLELRREHNLQPDQIRSVHVDIFKVAYEMIGGGKYVDPKSVRTKEDADHSLNYLVAVALLDGEVGPAQFEQSRVIAPDVQHLLRNVTAAPSFWYTRTYPRDMRCRITVELKNGKTLVHTKKDYSGFYKRPMSTEDVIAKFHTVADKVLPVQKREALIACVLDLENRRTRDLLELLRSATAQHPRAHAA